MRIVPLIPKSEKEKKLIHHKLCVICHMSPDHASMQQAQILQLIDYTQNSWFQKIALWLIRKRFKTGNANKSGWGLVPTQNPKF